jgi:hypothetical protein
MTCESRPSQWQLKIQATGASVLEYSYGELRNSPGNTARVAGMKKRTTITTEKREIWIIREEGAQTHVWNQTSSSDQSSKVKPEPDLALTVTEEKPPTTNEKNQCGEV